MVWNLILPLLVLLPSVSLDRDRDPVFCPYNEYVAQGETHIMCLPKNDSCRIVPTSGVTALDQALIVTLLNEIRNRVANGEATVGSGYILPQAANMRQLEWSDELARIAQAKADQCDLRPSCFNCRNTDEYSVGEMTYYIWNSYETQNTDWIRTLVAWARSGDRLTTISPDRSRPYFITQMIWGETKDVGCGVTRFKTFRPTRYTDYYVCLFGPAGVYTDRPAYEEGPPCSDCTYRDTCCNEGCTAAGITVEYEGLCKSTV